MIGRLRGTVAAKGPDGLRLDEVVKARDHGVSTEFLSEFKQLGFPQPSLADLANLRDHGVTPEFIRGLRSAGYDQASLDDAVRLRDRGVTPEFIKDLAAQGYRKLPVSALLRLRNHGVSAGFIADLAGIMNWASAPREDGYGSNGSDERDMAQAYYERVGYPYWKR